MESKQLVKALLTGQPAERMGFMDKVWQETVAKWRAQGKLLQQDPVTGEQRPVNFDEWFDADLCEVWAPFDVEPLLGYREYIEENEKWTIFRDGFGAAFKRWKDRTGVPEHIDFEMTDRSVWEKKYKPHLLGFEEKRIRVTTEPVIANIKQRNKFCSYSHIFIWEILRGALGDVQMYMSLLDDPDWILDVNRTYTDYYKKYFTYMFEVFGGRMHCGFMTTWLITKDRFVRRRSCGNSLCLFTRK